MFRGFGNPTARRATLKLVTILKINTIKGCRLMHMLLSVFTRVVLLIFNRYLLVITVSVTRAGVTFRRIPHGHAEFRGVSSLWVLSSN